MSTSNGSPSITSSPTTTSSHVCARAFLEGIFTMLSQRQNIGNALNIQDIASPQSLVLSISLRMRQARGKIPPITKWCIRVKFCAPLSVENKKEQK